MILLRQTDNNLVNDRYAVIIAYIIAPVKSISLLSEQIHFRLVNAKFSHSVVDRVTVYHDDRLVYSLKDGTEITVEL